MNCHETHACPSSELVRRGHAHSTASFLCPGGGFKAGRDLWDALCVMADGCGIFHFQSANTWHAVPAPPVLSLLIFH